MLNELEGNQPATKSTSKMPIVVVEDDAEIKQLIAICKAKMAEKAAKTNSEKAQEKFRPAAKMKFETQCQTDNQLHSSIKLTANSHSLTFTQKKECRKMVKSETDDDLHSIFGDEFDDHFGYAQTLTIDTGALSTEQIKQIILSIRKVLKYADNPATYKAAIGLTALIRPKESFYRDRILNSDFRMLAKRAEQDGLAVPHTPSFK